MTLCAPADCACLDLYHPGTTAARQCRAAFPHASCAVALSRAVTWPDPPTGFRPVRSRLRRALECLVGDGSLPFVSRKAADTALLSADADPASAELLLVLCAGLRGALLAMATARCGRAAAAAKVLAVTAAWVALTPARAPVALGGGGGRNKKRKRKKKKKKKKRVVCGRRDCQCRWHHEGWASYVACGAGKHLSGLVGPPKRRRPYRRRPPRWLQAPPPSWLQAPPPTWLQAPQTLSPCVPAGPCAGLRFAVDRAAYAAAVACLQGLVEPGTWAPGAFFRGFERGATVAEALHLAVLAVQGGAGIAVMLQLVNMAANLAREEGPDARGALAALAIAVAAAT